jgi:addiction module HigA family antidote
VSHLLTGQSAVTADLALRLGSALNQTPQYWFNLQTAYDLKMTEIKLEDSLLEVHALAAA